MDHQTSAQVQAALARIRAATAANRELTAELSSERAQLAADSTEREERRATAARRGELGDDWRTLQARIDARRTTLADIMTGRDQSPEAQRVTGQALERIGGIREEFDQAVRRSDPSDPGSPAAAIQATLAAQDEIRRTLQRLRGDA